MSTPPLPVVPLGPFHPDLFGPLSTEPVVQTGPAVLFAGEERFLSARALRRREALRDAVAPRVRLLLQEGERLLHLLPAVRVPPLGQQLALGVWYVRFFKVALVLTDQRLIEVGLGSDGHTVGTSTQSFPWSQARKLAAGLRGFRLTPAKGRTDSWRLAEGGDRKLLKALVPNLSQNVLAGGAAAPRPVPLWHCPTCGAAAEKHPASCESCGTAFKSSNLAAALALAIPGGGLMYARRPVLAAFDVLGEALVFVLVAIGFLVAGTGEEKVAALVVGLLLFLLTKVESAHLAHIFAHRTVPEAAPTRRRWVRAAVAGGVLSVVLMALPPALAGRMDGTVNHDLTFEAQDLGWSGGHDPSAWVEGVDENQRSEWIHADGQELFVFAASLGLFESFESLRQELSDEPVEDVTDRRVEPLEVAGLEGLWATETVKLGSGAEMRRVHCFIFDRTSRELHFCLTHASPDNLAEVSARTRQLLSRARWVAAKLPDAAR